jgi:hypothetical protein
MARVFLIQAQAPLAQPLLIRESQFVPHTGIYSQVSCSIGHAIHNNDHFGKEKIHILNTARRLARTHSAGIRTPTRLGDSISPPLNNEPRFRTAIIELFNGA